MPTNSTTPESTKPRLCEPASRAVLMPFREVRFCNFYLEHGNATKAARDAGYTSVSEGGLRFMACKLRVKPNVANYIAEAIGHFLDAEKITTAKIAQALAFEAFADRTAIFDQACQILDLRDWPSELRGLILDLEITETIDPAIGKTTTKVDKVKFATPTAARKVLAQWRGLIGARVLTAE